MLRIIALFVLLFSVLLVLFWPRGYTESPSVAFLWQYDLQSGQPGAAPPELGSGAPFNLVRVESGVPAMALDGLTESGAAEVDVPGPDTNTEAPANGEAGPALLGPGVPGLALESRLRYYAAFQGRGYFQYAKIGRELSFHSRRGEELWRKPYKAYPVSDVRGQLVLLLTGDNNRVDVIDQSGNPTGVRSVAGNFMTDLDFATRRSAVAIVFSTGALRVLNQSGELVLDYQYKAANESEALFVKSCAIGPDARRVALHLLAGDRDRLIVLGFDPDDGQPTNYKLLRDIDLPGVYPHLLHFALNRHGLLLTAPERTEFFALDSGSDRSISQAEAEQAGRSVYRPVFADREYFVYGALDRPEAVVLTANGERLMRLQQQDTPATATAAAAGDESRFRIVPGPQPGQFSLHGQRRVQIFAYRDPALDHQSGVEPSR